MTVPDVSRRRDLPPITAAPRSRWRDGNPLHVDWCPVCRCNTLPDRTGRCLFCDHLTVRRTGR